MRDLISKCALLTTTLLVTGCTVPGGLASGVDPEEGHLVQKLIEESCGQIVTVNEDDKIVRRSKVSADDIAVLEIKDTTDGGRIAWFRIIPKEYRILYHPRFAMVDCDVDIFAGLNPSYTHSSPILIQRGGDPSLYQRSKKNGRVARQTPPKKVYERVGDIRVHWEGYDKPFLASVREIGDRTQGVFAIDFEGDDFGLCTGSFQNTPNNNNPWRDAKWDITCTNAIKASGTFRYTSTGSIGMGNDNRGRAIMFVTERRK